MMTSRAKTVRDYLAALPEERRAALQAVRKVILENLPRGFEEGMQYGMIGYYVPLSRYPKTYNGQALTIAALASQKQYMSLYLMSVYGHGGHRSWFEEAFRASGKKLDMGKSCVRFKSIADLPLDVVGQAIGKVGVEPFLATYEENRASLASKAPQGRAKRARTTSKTKSAKPQRVRARTAPSRAR